MKKLIPADTVDAAGNVWGNVGENIRKGAKEFSEDIIKEIVNILFPVGSVYCGTNAFILSVGKWKHVNVGANGRAIIMASSSDGKYIDTNKIITSTTEYERYTALHIYERTE